MSRPNPSKKQLARDTLAAMVALSKTAGMDADSSRESSPEYSVYDNPPSLPAAAPERRESMMQVDSVTSASLPQGRGYAASAQPREEGHRSRAPSIFLESDTEGRGKGRGLSKIREEGEMDDDDSAVLAKGTKRQASPAVAFETKKQAIPQLLPVPPKAASRTSARSASKSKTGSKSSNKARLPFPQGFRAYNPNPNPNDRAVSPSEVGPSKGWYRNQIADGVVQDDPPGGGGPAPVQIDKTRENQVVVSVEESMTEKQMHDAFEKRLKSMDKRDRLYFADAANSFVNAPVIFRDDQVTFPLSAEFRKKLPVFRSIVHDMEVLLTYPRSALINILILAKREGMLTETWDAEKWLHDNINTVWGNVGLCSKFTEYGLPALHPYVIGKCLAKQEKMSHQMSDLDFLPLSDVGRAELDKNLENIKQSILELNRHITSVHKTPKTGDEESLFDIVATKKLASNADGLVNSVLSALGSKGKKTGEIEALVHGFTTKFIATGTVSAVLLIITGTFLVDRSEFVRGKLIELFTSSGFQRTLGTAFSVGCSQQIATFIGEIALYTGKTLKLSAEQIEYIYESITNAITSIRGVEPVAKGNVEQAFDNFAEWGYHVEQGALKSRTLERARSASAEENWGRYKKQGAKDMRERSASARNTLLYAMSDTQDTLDTTDYDEEDYDGDEDEDTEEDDDKETQTSKGKKGGKRTTKRSKVTKKRKQKKTKTVKRKRRITKKK
uniref:Uncharacterized protein n=1 Tax=viral metagenome TaxID=1070528 RepID=A0A6C0B1Z8_9ZZZZ